MNRFQYWMFRFWFICDMLQCCQSISSFDSSDKKVDFRSEIRLNVPTITKKLINRRESSSNFKQTSKSCCYYFDFSTVEQSSSDSDVMPLWWTHVRERKNILSNMMRIGRRSLSNPWRLWSITILLCDWKPKDTHLYYVTYYFFHRALPSSILFLSYF